MEGLGLRGQLAQEEGSSRLISPISLVYLQ